MGGNVWRRKLSVRPGLVLEQVQPSSDVIHLLQSSNVFLLHLVVKKVMFQVI